MIVSFLFPGQGSQYPEMLNALLQYPVAKKTIDEASEILDLDVLSLDSASELQSTVSVQIALFVAGVASARSLMDAGIAPHAVAGLSVGAYTAAVACDCISFHDGLRLVKRRAELMHEGYPSGFGMTVIVGLTEQKVQNLVQQFHAADVPIYMSNINAPFQITVSGNVVGLESLEQAALAAGARKVERLNVSVPSHCQLYDSAARTLKAEFAHITKQSPRCTYVSNIRARPLRDEAAIVDDLACNIACGVRWFDSMSLLVELGTETFIELAPGNTLSKLCVELFPLTRAFAFEQSSVSFLKKYLAND